MPVPFCWNADDCNVQRRALTGAFLAGRISGTTIDAIAELLLGRAELGQECDRIERAILIAQALLHAAERS